MSEDDGYFMIARLAGAVFRRHCSSMFRCSDKMRFAWTMALRALMIAAVVAVSSAPMTARAELGAAPCMAGMSHGDNELATNDRHAMAIHDEGAPVACDTTCPMHLALTPAGIDPPSKSAPKSFSRAVPEPLTGHAPPSAERPPRALSA